MIWEMASSMSTQYQIVYIPAQMTDVIEILFWCLKDIKVWIWRTMPRLNQDGMAVELEVKSLRQVSTALNRLLLPRKCWAPQGLTASPETSGSCIQETL